MDINFSKATHKFSYFMHRFHLIIFVVVALGALGLGIFTIYQKTLAADLSQGYAAQTNNTNFDTQTIDRISKLRTSDFRSSPAGKTEQRDISITGDVNPFVEN